ncbi:tyrosine recombinase [Candidatus Methylacidithermus pantelleriae]|uniref:Tyrosine recombinase XerC n=1 Tax=Candidatus Methylacidithermus pantelleriae TaxID=2744239 RepID=A0A8J2BK03_9BACT|nr:tyrosine recombinase [Candidatus Methylacidithermus pantelleriae]CAF0694625.1 Tyrosine recombinase XerC [Candidatus Methylacidithermus pantelleriae]
MPPKNPTCALPSIWEEERNQCIAYLAVERGQAENSQIVYLLALERFARWVQIRYGLVPVEKVQRQHIEEYLQDEQRTHRLSPSSVKILIVALKHFFRFLLQKGTIHHDPTALLPTPRVPFALPHVLSEEEITRLLRVPYPESPLGLRNRAILELFYASGIRLGELVRLRVEWFSPDTATLRVLGKGNRERIVPIGGPARRALIAYLERGRPFLQRETSGGELFLAQHGKRLTPRRVYEIVRGAAQRAGLAAKLHPHLLRHSFATHLLTHGADLRVIQELLGHASLSTTQRYTHVEAQRLLAVHQKFHPRKELATLNVPEAHYLAEDLEKRRPSPPQS